MYAIKLCRFIVMKQHPCPRTRLTLLLGETSVKGWVEFYLGKKTIHCEFVPAPGIINRNHLLIYPKRLAIWTNPPHFVGVSHKFPDI